MVWVPEFQRTNADFIESLELRGIPLVRHSIGSEYVDLMKLPVKCKHLADDGMCSIYEQRPDICREFPATPLDLEGLERCTYYFTQTEG